MSEANALNAKAKEKALEFERLLKEIEDLEKKLKKINN